MRRLTLTAALTALACAGWALWRTGRLEAAFELDGLVLDGHLRQHEGLAR